MDFAALEADVRSRIGEASARKFSQAEIQRWLNQGYREFVAKTNWTQKIHGISAVASQFEYDLPSDVVKIHRIMFDDQYTIRPRSNEEFFRAMGLSNTQTSDRPRIYTAFPWEKRIRLFPIPNSAAASTTVDGAHNSTVTTITVADASSFPTVGRIKINNEVILYTGTTATTFTGCTRGVDRTTAASHSDTDAVTELDIQVYISYRPADMSGSSDVPAINEEYHTALVDYAVAVCLVKRDRYKDSKEMMASFMRRVNDALGEKTREHLDQYYSLIDDADYGD